MTDSDVKTRPEVAQRLGVTEVTVGRWTEDGRLTAIREKPWLYASDEVERFAGVLARELEDRAARLKAEAATA